MKFKDLAKYPRRWINLVLNVSYHILSLPVVIKGVVKIPEQREIACKQIEIFVIPSSPTRWSNNLLYRDKPAGRLNDGFRSRLEGGKA